jgi:tricorn protease
VVDRENGEECLEIWDSGDYTVTSVPEPAENGSEGWGRFTLLETSPKGEHVAFANHRNELWLLDLAAGTSRKLARSSYGPMSTFSWSPDGRWLALQQSASRHQFYIAIANVETGEVLPVTEPLFADSSPSFDPEGQYLYFLSDRVLNPVYDELQFELSFPKAALPCLVTLRKDTPSPFLEAASDDPDCGGKDKDKDKDKENGKELKVEIDFDGISSRILAFPVPEGRYASLAGLKKKAVWLSFPIKGALIWKSGRPSRQLPKEAWKPSISASSRCKPLAVASLASGSRQIGRRCCLLPRKS